MYISGFRLDIFYWGFHHIIYIKSCRFLIRHGSLLRYPEIIDSSPVSKMTTAASKFKNFFVRVNAMFLLTCLSLDLVLYTIWFLHKKTVESRGAHSQICLPLHACMRMNTMHIKIIVSLLRWEEQWFSHPFPTTLTYHWHGLPNTFSLNFGRLLLSFLLIFSNLPFFA